MRQPTIYHPLFATHPRNGINTSMTDTVEIYKPTGEQAKWSPADGMTGSGYELIYRGPGRVQPNIDWRARDRNHSGELNAIIAVRVQVPFGGNTLFNGDESVAKDYVVNVIETSVDDNKYLLNYTIVIRNAIMASQKWLRSYLGDTGTRVVLDG